MRSVLIWSTDFQNMLVRSPTSIIPSMPMVLFVEMAIKYSNALNKKVHYSVQGSLGVNAEYVSDGHNGLNYVQLRTNASYHPILQIELYAYAGYNQAIDRDAIQYAGDVLLNNFYWSGIGMTYLF